MDSVVAIAQGIAELDCEPQIKECLQSLFNLELVNNSGTPVTKLTYIREIESRYDQWQSGSDEVIE